MRIEHGGKRVYFREAAQHLNPDEADFRQPDTSAHRVLRPGNVVAGAAAGTVIQSLDALLGQSGKIRLRKRRIHRLVKISGAFRRIQAVHRRCQCGIQDIKLPSIAADGNAGLAVTTPKIEPSVAGVPIQLKLASKSLVMMKPVFPKMMKSMPNGLRG